MSSQEQIMKYARNGKRRKGELDLNVPLVDPEHAGEPAVAMDQGGQINVPAVPVVCAGEVHQPAGSTLPASIDVEELDDDIFISSSREFEEAKRKSRRRLVIDVEAEDVTIGRGLNQANKRRRCHPDPPVINCEEYVNLEGSSGSMLQRDKTQYIAPPPLPPPPPPPPKEPTFSCPVCMGPLVEEVTTKCGHIFCKACITAAIKAQHKCPTCRQKLTNRNIIRVYLPTAK